MKKREDRWKECVEQFKKYDISMNNVIRWDAIVGNDMSNDEINTNTSTFCKYFCNKGTVGCFLSHQSVWKDVAKNGYKKVLVLEDDIQFVNPENIKKYFKQVPNDWDIVYVGSYGSTVNPNICFLQKNIKVGENVVIPCYTSGTHAYIISDKSANKLLKALPKAEYHADIAINSKKEIKKYAFVPQLINQSLSNTDIQTTGSTMLTKLSGDYILGTPSKSFWNTSILNVCGKDVTLILILQIIGGLLGGKFKQPLIPLIIFILTLSTNVKNNIFSFFIILLFYFLVL